MNTPKFSLLLLLGRSNSCSNSNYSNIMKRGPGTWLGGARDGPGSGNMACVLCLHPWGRWTRKVESKLHLDSSPNRIHLCCSWLPKLIAVLFRRLAKSALYSEDSESGEVLRKRFRASNQDEDEDEEADVGTSRLKKRSKSWNEQEASSGYSHEVCSHSTLRLMRHANHFCNSEIDFVKLK